MALVHRSKSVMFALASAVTAAMVLGSGPAPTEMTAPATQPTTKPMTAKRHPATAPSPEEVKQVKQLMKEFGATNGQLQKAFANSVLTDSDKRAAAAPQVLPILTQRSDLVDQLVKTHLLNPQMTTSMKQETQALLYLFGDPKTVTSIDAQTKDEHPKAQIEAQGLQLHARWMGTPHTAAMQTPVADELEKLDRANPASGYLTMLTKAFSDSAADMELHERLAHLITDVKTDPYAKAIQKSEEEQADAKAKLDTFVGKPMTVTEKTVEGKDFTTADWTGKVVLVDFWATWCQPCIAGLPHVKSVYAKYHDQGFEIVGVSNDQKIEDLIAFTPKNAMPWPQLFDPKSADEGEWNSLAKQYSVMLIPRMFIIDKKGVCRSIDGAADMDKMVPMLLAE